MKIFVFPTAEEEKARKESKALRDLAKKNRSKSNVIEYKKPEQECSDLFLRCVCGRKIPYAHTKIMFTHWHQRAFLSKLYNVDEPQFACGDCLNYYHTLMKAGMFHCIRTGSGYQNMDGFVILYLKLLAVFL